MALLLLLLLTTYTLPCNDLLVATRGARQRAAWDAAQIRALRRRLGMTQQQLAAELNVRQQTVSEWETGQYRPRGASERLLSIVAERTAFRYDEPAAGAEP